MNYKQAENIAEQYWLLALELLEDELEDIRQDWEAVWYEKAYDEFGLIIDERKPLSGRLYDLFMNDLMIERIMERSAFDQLYTMPENVTELCDIQDSIGF
jgi:hypothetical protein